MRWRLRNNLLDFSSLPPQPTGIGSGGATKPVTRPAEDKPAKPGETSEQSPERNDDAAAVSAEIETSNVGRALESSSPTEESSGTTPKSGADTPHVPTPNSDRSDTSGDSKPTGGESPSPYAGQMKAVDEAIDSGVDPESLPGYIAKGGTCYVYETPDKRIIKVPRVGLDYEDEDGNIILDRPVPFDVVRTDYVVPLGRGKGVDGLEQIVDYVPPTLDNKGAVIVERAPGKPFSDLTQEEINIIPVKHYEKLIATYTEAARRDIQPDYDGHNVMYDKEKGFTVIDYQVRGPDLPSRTPEEAAGFFTNPGLLFNLRRQGDDFPEAGRRYFQAYRNKFGDEATDALREQLRNWFQKAERAGGHKMEVPDDL